MAEGGNIADDKILRQIQAFGLPPLILCIAFPCAFPAISTSSGRPDASTGGKCFPAPR